MAGQSVEVLQGTLDLIVLKDASSSGPMHGFGIARWIQRTTDDAPPRQEEEVVVPRRSTVWRTGAGSDRRTRLETEERASAAK